MEEPTRMCLVILLLYDIRLSSWETFLCDLELKFQPSPFDNHQVIQIWSLSFLVF